MLDTEWVRRQFPALAGDWALCDQAGGSPPLAGVIDAVASHMRAGGVQLGASYPLSREATARVQAGHAAAALLLGAPESEVVLGPSSTTLVRHLARALAPRFAPGDALVVTDLDHECNIGAWSDLAADAGLTLRVWAMDPANAELTLAGLEAVLTPRTRLVCFTHCANVVGAMHDAAGFVRRIHAAGALACVDGVAYAPHRLVDAAALGADVYFVSLYKVYGPHLAAMRVASPLLASLRSQNHFFLPPDAGPYRLEPGGVPHELAAGVPAITDYLIALGRRHGAAGAPDRAALEHAFEVIAAHEQRLSEALLAGLAALPRVRVLGPLQPDAAVRVPTVAFTVAGAAPERIVAEVDAHRVAMRHGHFYAHRAMERLGLLAHGGVLRASLNHVNTLEEVARLLAALGHAVDAVPA
jgi:cysteine desulfurase family protein (TIGR01976 family)